MHGAWLALRASACTLTVALPRTVVMGSRRPHVTEGFLFFFLFYYPFLVQVNYVYDADIHAREQRFAVEGVVEVAPRVGDLLKVAA